MKYFVTYLLEGTYNLGDKFTAKASEKTECNKEVYDYLNSTFGSSGWFTFAKEGVETKPKKPKATPKVKVEPKAKTTKDEK